MSRGPKGGEGNGSLMGSIRSREGGASRFIWHLARPYRRRILMLALLSFAGALLEAGFLVLITSTVLALAGGATQVGPILGRSYPVVGALTVAAVTVLLRLALSLAGVRVSSALAADVTTDQRHRLSDAYLGSSWSIQQAEPSGRLQELLTSFVSQVNGAMTAATQGVTASLSLMAFLSTGMVIDPVSTIAVLGALGILGGVLAPLRRRIRRRAALSAQSSLDFASTVAELGALGQEMQTFGVQNQFADRIDRLTSLTTEQQRQVQNLSGALSPVYTFLAYSAVLTGLGILSLLGVGNLTAIGAVMLLMLRSLSYGQQLLAVSGRLAASIPFLERLNATVDRYRASPASHGHRIPARVTPLDARAVSFLYAADRPALSALDVRIEQGEMIGVIGPSGAGKSTLAQLLLGLRDPSEGVIRAGGINLRDIDRSWWTRRVAFVPQDPLLFTGTIAENLRFFRDGLTDGALRHAAIQANILPDIIGLPHGFDTHLGERGSQLSGGQRQRLSIARALVGEPELLILDEPTSALDGESEALIRGALERLHGVVTVVIIAHRMSTLDLCDRIMVIENGSVTAFESPATLRGRSKFYRNALAVAGISAPSNSGGEKA